MRTNRTYLNPRTAALAAVVACWPSAFFGQATAPAPTSQPADKEEEDEVVVLSPFEVVSAEDNSYITSNTLAGNRLNTELKDLGTSLSVYNKTFLNDVGATDNQTLLRYTLSTETGGIYGNYSGSGGGTAPNANAALDPQSNNRVRGLVAADNTRDLFLSSIPWDGYNIDAVDLQRGPNAILFGQGSPGGVINTRSKQATFRDLGELSVRFDQYGSVRGTLDANRVLLDQELAVRFAGVVNRSEFKQEPAYEDSNRGYAAVRYEPGFLKRSRARTILKADIEFGHSKSNRPRNLPPVDRITPWFWNLQGQLFNPAWMNDNHPEIPGRGIAAQNNSSQQPNPIFNQYVNVNWGNNYFGGTEFLYLPGQETAALALALQPVAYLGRNAAGARDGNIGGLAPGGPRGIRGYRDWAVATRQPFATLAKDTYVTDPNVFDFYNNLLDGVVKYESADFQAFNTSLSQTFFDDMMGFDVGYHTERYETRNFNPIGGGPLFVDYNSVWMDGTNDAPGGWYTDSTPNPGAGRPFVYSGWPDSTNEGQIDRDSLRGTAFVSHNFHRGDSDNWFTRLLGTHTITGMGSRDDYNAFDRAYTNHLFTGDYWLHPQFEGLRQANGRFWPDFIPGKVFYVGDSLVGKNLGDDLGIRPPSVVPTIGETVNIRFFDSTWTGAVSPNPGDPWLNQVTAAGLNGPTVSTQSENPRNYVGWVNRDVRVLKSDDPRNREALTRTKNWDDRVNKARALVWQGKFWDNSIIGTAGIRRDEVSQVTTRWDYQNTGTNSRATGDPALVIPVVQTLGPVKENSKSWGVVTHVNRLPFLAGPMEKAPLDVSFSYNRSDNFQTGQLFRDYWGQQHPLPAGETEDIGLLLATKNGKYSLKLNKFESTVANNPSGSLQFWNYGNNVGIYAQAWSQIKYNYEVRSNPSSTRYGNNIISDLPVPTTASPNNKWTFDYQAVAGQTQAEAEALEIAVINAWDAWLAEMAPLPELMANAWGFSWQTNDLTESGLGSFRFTSDLIAKGYEAELNAQITDGWRLTVNASRIKSYIDNIGQTLAPGGQMTLVDYLLDFDRRLNDTVMGDLRIWSPSDAAGNARNNWNGYADGDLKARIAEQGTVVPENRLWHVNLITNYDFHEGRLRGWNLGGSLRYQSAAVLAYTPIQNGNAIGYDLNAPFKDKAQIDVDVWVGYSRKMFSDKINWNIKLNVANVGVGNSLLPVTVQPDGNHAARRIRPPQHVFMTNTFSF